VNPATRLTEESLKSIVEYRHKLFLKEVVKIAYTMCQREGGSRTLKAHRAYGVASMQGKARKLRIMRSMQPTMPWRR